jgi:hypothetical protein
MATKSDKATGASEETIERIRELNEQILEAGRQWGQSFLDAYEQSMRTFADFRAKAGESTNIEWISSIAKAQADFTREVTRQATEAARRMYQQ